MSKTGNFNISDDMRLTVSTTTKVTCNDKLLWWVRQ